MKLFQFLRGGRSPLKAQLQLSLSAMVLARQVCAAVGEVSGMTPDFRTMDVSLRSRLIEDAAALIEQYAAACSPSRSALIPCAGSDDTAVWPRTVEKSGQK